MYINKQKVIVRSVVVYTLCSTIVDKSLLGLVHGKCTHCRRLIDQGTLNQLVFSVSTFPMYQLMEGFIYFVSWQLHN